MNIDKVIYQMKLEKEENFSGKIKVHNTKEGAEFIIILNKEIPKAPCNK